MDSYKVLSQQVFKSDDYSLVPIRTKDRYDIMNWRNDQMYHLRQSKPLTKASQDAYFENIVSNLFQQDRPDQILFSFLKQDKCIGYGGLVHINWIDENAEISFIMETELEKNHFQELWRTFLQLIEVVAFEELDLHKLYVYAFDLRPHLYTSVASAGYFKDAHLNEHCLFNGRYIDVVIHSKLNLQQ